MNEQVVSLPSSTFETTSLTPEYEIKVSENTLSEEPYYLDISVENYNISKIYLKTVPRYLTEISILVGGSPFATFPRWQLEQSLHTRKNLLDHLCVSNRPVDILSRTIIVPVYDVKYQTVSFTFRYTVSDSLEREDDIDMEPVYSDDYELFIDRYEEEHEGRRCIGETPVVRGQVLKHPLRIKTPEIDFVLQETKHVSKYTMHIWQPIKKIEDPEYEQRIIRKFQYDRVLGRIRNVFRVYDGMGSFTYVF